MTPEALVKRISRFKPYFKQNGGVTFSGGEPLMQPEFLLKTLKLCKQEGIHTCIDTAGFGQGDYDEILSYTEFLGTFRSQGNNRAGLRVYDRKANGAVHRISKGIGIETARNYGYAMS